MTVSATARRSLVLAAAAAILLAGCSGSADPEGSAAADAIGPLDEYTARIYGYSFDQSDQQSTEELEAEADQQMRAVEELVATCMADEGFDYTPSTMSGTAVDLAGLDVEWGSAEFAAQYGYGISTDPWGTADLDVTDEWQDPNSDYVAAMSDSEREA
ncbi:MAG TPA: hypothetical protein VGC67_09160 [Cellulomonas sp.]